MSAAVLAFVMRHEALLGWAAVLAGAALAGAVLMHRAEAPALARAQAGAAQAAGAAHLAAAQSQLDWTSSAAVIADQTREADLARTTETYAHAVQTAPQSSQALAPDVLRAWALGVDGLRDEAARARAGPAPDGGAGAAPAVPAPGSPGGA